MYVFIISTNNGNTKQCTCLSSKEFVDLLLFLCLFFKKESHLGSLKHGGLREATINSLLRPMIILQHFVIPLPHLRPVASHLKVVRRSALADMASNAVPTLSVPSSPVAWGFLVL